MPERDTKIGKPIEITGRTIYPIMESFFIKNENQGFIAIEIFPIALVVEEPDNEYIISLTEDEISPKNIIEMISPEKEHEKTVIMLLKRCSE